MGDEFPCNGEYKSISIFAMLGSVLGKAVGRLFTEAMRIQDIFGYQNSSLDEIRVRGSHCLRVYRSSTYQKSILSSPSIAVKSS